MSVKPLEQEGDISPDWSWRIVNRPWWSRKVGMPRRNASACSPLPRITVPSVERRWCRLHTAA
jgi:hypothetical protein